MELLDSYIRLLRLFLPRRQRDDIAREIAEEIREQLDDRQAALGRPLTVDEQAEVIGRYGHPLVTAARYRPQQHLIGPIVFPYYWLVLKLVLALTLFGHAVAMAVLMSDRPSWLAIGQALEGTLQNVFAVVAWLTVVAAVADRLLARSQVLQRWDPRSLVHRAPASQAASGVDTTLRASAPAWQKAAALFESPSTTFGLVSAVALSAWWLLALRYPVLMFGPGASHLDWGPDMDRLYPLLVATTGVLLIERFAKVLWPRQPWLLQVTGWVAPLVGVLFILGVASSHNQWVVWSGSPTTRTVAIGGMTVPLLDFVNLAFGLPFGLVAVVSALSLIRRGYQWVSGSRNRGARSMPAICLVLVSSSVGSVAQAHGPDDAAIRRILEERVDATKQSVGIVVGIVTPQGRRVIRHGRFAVGDAREVGPELSSRSAR